MRRLPLHVRIWAPLGLLALLTLAATARPLAVGWACYRQYDDAERVETRVVGKDPRVELVLQIQTGPHAGSHCTAETNDAHFAEAEPGDVLRAVVPAERPDTCVLEATIERSGALLWGVGSLLVVLLLLLVLLGLFLQRTFTRPTAPTTRFDLPGGGMACPQCDAPMAEGYVAPMAGVHWRDAAEPIGLPLAVGGLPGTVGWRGRPRLHAYRCPKCRVVTFRYGSPRR